MTEIDLSKPLSKETEALMAMQYDGIFSFIILKVLKLDIEQILIYESLIL